MSNYISASGTHHVNIHNRIVQNLESLISQENFAYNCDFFSSVEKEIRTILLINVFPQFILSFEENGKD